MMHFPSFPHQKKKEKKKEYLPSIAPLEVSEAPGASALEGDHVESSQPQAGLLLGPNANLNFLQRRITDRTTETGSVSESIDTPI